MTMRTDETGKRYIELSDNGKKDWYETAVTFFSNVFTIFRPIATSGLSIAAALTGDPKVMAAQKIYEPSADILAGLLAQAESDTPNYTVDPAKVDALVKAVKYNGATVNAK